MFFWWSLFRPRTGQASPGRRLSSVGCHLRMLWRRAGAGSGGLPAPLGPHQGKGAWKYNQSPDGG